MVAWQDVILGLVFQAMPALASLLLTWAVMMVHIHQLARLQQSAATHGNPTLVTLP